MATTPSPSVATTRKRKQVPEVLWRLFGNRARPLADTILSLIPPPPDTQAACPCKRRRGCLSCSGGDAMSFLVRSGDSQDYRKLLNGCFVVVSEDAPPFPFFDPHRRWSQREIVRRSIEIMLSEQPCTSNLICCSYDKERHSSATVDELTSSKWTVLLRRVGDSLMVYLLKYTSMFLPLARKKHHQISGSSIGDLCSKSSWCIPKSRSQHHPLAVRENEIKRKRVEGDELPRKQLRTYSLGSEPSSNSTSFATRNENVIKRKRVEGDDLPGEQLCTYSLLGSEPSSNSTSFATRNENEIKRKRVEGDELPKKQLCTYSLGSEPNSTSFATRNGGSTYVYEEISDKQSEVNSKKNTAISQKHTRQHCRLRQRKYRQLAIGGTPLIPCRGNSFTSDNLSLFSSSSQSHMNISHCFCCSVFQNGARMNRNAEIDRKHIFYKLKNSSSMLPMKHILYTLKPNGPGASVLFNNIFEAFGPDKNSGSIQCCHSKKGYPTSSFCLYHSLTKLLKNLIRKSQNCRYMRLLEKHCCIRSSSYQKARRGVGTRPEVLLTLSVSFQKKGVSDPGSLSPSLSPLKGNYSANNLSMSRRGGVQSEVKLVQVADAKNQLMIPKTTSAQVEPIKSCLKSQIVSFIWAICRRVVPSQLLGDPSNWRIMRKNISKFIWLRRFEKFSLKECIHKLEISKFPIFSNKHTGCSGLRITDIARHAIFECWMFWLFTHLVSPLVQANFYVTESEHEKQEVLYYSKSTWEKLIRGDECMTDGKYCLLDHKSARDKFKNRSFGFSRARLLPKHKGFRLLSNLRAPSRFPVNPPSSRTHSNKKSQRKSFGIHRVKYRFYKSVNSVLHDVHVVLKGLCAKKPEQLGSSVFNYNDVYKKLVPFLFHLKNGSTSLPSVFIVVSDVSKAFDSVEHGRLLRVMKDVISDDKFTMEKFTQVICTRKSLKIDQQLMLEHKDIVAASTRIRSRFRAQTLGCVVVKKELGRRMRKEEINSILKEHITKNVVQLGNKLYHQCVGIPQGSILSPLLCSLYYGYIERNLVFPFLEKSNADLLAKHHSPDGTSASGGNHKMEISARGCEYLLLRFIDDFLFISTSKKQASMFFSRLERGFKSYNCWMNKEKYGLNFTMDNGQNIGSNRVHIGKDGISFHHWSGLLVNCSTLEIQADYTRYLNSHLCSTLTVCRQGKVGQNLKAKLQNYLKPKCYPIFYDSNINSPGVVRLNIYQAFLICAMKFICHLSNLSILPRFNLKFCINAIETSMRYMYRLIKRKMFSFHVDPSFRPKFDVKKEDVMWLGLYAYCRVLQKKQSRYRYLLHLFRCKLKAYGKLENMSPELKYAVDDEHSSVLWSIKY